MLLELLVIGALMGILGQGARAIIGLKGMADDAQAQGLSSNDLFETGRLLTSFLIGIIVGLASVLVYLKSGGSATVDPTWQTMLAWAVSAYAGTDFLEGFISQYLSPGTTTTALNVQKLAFVSVGQPSALSIVQNACQMAFGLPASAVTTDQALGKASAGSPGSPGLGLSSLDFVKLEGFINTQLTSIPGAKVLGKDALNEWQAQGSPAPTVKTVVKNVTDALP